MMENITQGEDGDLEALEPQVTSSDPNVRKMARTLRIKRRIEAIRKQHEPMNEEEQEANKTALETQVMKSAEQLEQLLIEGEELITNVSVGNDRREVRRRENEKQLRAELMQRLDSEAEQAGRMYGEISERWPALLLHNDPLDIHASIGEQQARCKRLLSQKDELIAELREQLDRAELELAREQRSQREELAMLGSRIDRQVELMRGAYRAELRLIETAVEAERARLAGDGLQRWRQLHEQRDQLEERNMLKKNEQQDEYLSELHDNRIGNEELYRETKIALENENQVLQQELEHLKAFCMLNSEKLDYNYQILKKREDENLIIKSQQKRLINRLRDEINRTRASTEQYRARSRSQVERLTREIHKLRDSVLNVEAKADLLTQANDAKYHSVWKHNEQLATERLHQILAADRIISEQLLGTDWVAPRWTRVELSGLPSYRVAVHRRRQLAPPSPHPPADGWPPEDRWLPVSVQNTILAKISDRSGFIMEWRLVEIVQRLRAEQGELVRVESVFQALGISQPESMKSLMECFLPYMWCAVCEGDDAGGGLGPSAIDMHTVTTVSGSCTTVQEIPDMLADVQQPLRVVDQLVAQETRSMSTYEDEEESLLVAEIAVGGGAAESTGTTEDQSSGAGMIGGDTASASSVTSGDVPASTRSKQLALRQHIQEGHAVTMEAAYVHKALKQFALRLAAGGGGCRQTQDQTMEERLSRQRVTVSRALSREDVAQFWTQFSNAFPRQRQQLWDGLLHGLTRYHAVLKDRHKINQELVRLRRQNAELRHLLDTCDEGRDSCALSGARL